MVNLSSSTKIKITTESILSDYNTFLIYELYMPIIGSDATSLYIYLHNQLRKNNTDIEVSDITSNLNKSLANFISSRKLLEAVGLTTTYSKKEGKDTKLIIVLYASKSPKRFFDNIILCKLLEKELGTAEFLKKKEYFKVNVINKSDYTREEVKLTDIFDIQLDKNDFNYDQDSNTVYVDFKTRRTRLNFDFDRFFNLLEEKSDISRNYVKSSDKEVISSIANLYAYNEDYMVDAFIYSFDKKKVLLDEKKIKDYCFNNTSYLIDKKSKNNKDTSYNINSDSLLATKIKYMEELSPYNYLKAKQEGVPPVKSDVNILYDLSHKLNLENGVINALLDYVLEKNNNIISRPLIEKIGASLLRNNITNAFDAMNFLVSLNSESNTSKSTNENEDEGSVSDKEKEELLKDLKEAFKHE